jgi:hypothetical protein
MLIGLLVLNVFLFKLVPATFFPEQDTGILIGQIMADQSISFPAMKQSRPWPALRVTARSTPPPYSSYWLRVL